MAREFRRADVDAFLSELSARQLDEWLALYEIEAEEAERRNKQQRGRG